MPKCSFCDHPNPPGAERCEGCGAWVAPVERGEPDRDRLPEVGPTSDPAGHEDDLRGRVRSLLAEGRKIEAIKVYRRATGAGLKESKDAVYRLELDHAAKADRIEVTLTYPGEARDGRKWKVEWVDAYRG